MKIYQDGLNSLSRKLESASSTYNSGVNSKVNSFITEMNKTWCSNNAKKFATEVQKCLESANTAIKTFSNDLNTLITENVNNYNRVEDESITYNGVVFNDPNVGELSNTNARFADGGTGMEVDNGGIISTFGEIHQVYIALFDDLQVAFNDQLFDSDEQSAFVGKISKIKNDFNTALNEVKTSFNSRVNDEIAERQRTASENKARIDAL